ncbi:hypothetical protein P9209_26700 [Prescottella defluvii]|nr:hypothetical protein P9209_26700 [Prescottella defluvii]
MHDPSAKLAVTPVIGPALAGAPVRTGAASAPPVPVAAPGWLVGSGGGDTGSR